MILATMETRNATWQVAFPSSASRKWVLECFDQLWRENADAVNAKHGFRVIDPELFNEDDVNITDMRVGFLYKDGSKAGGGR